MGRRLVGKNSGWLRRRSWKREGLPDQLARCIFAERPGLLALGGFGRQHVGGRDEIRILDAIANPHLPGKFTQYKSGARSHAIEMAISAPLKHNRGLADRKRLSR